MLLPYSVPRLYRWPITSVVPILRDVCHDDHEEFRTMIVPCRPILIRLIVMVHTVSVSLHRRLGTCCHLISTSETLVENRSSQTFFQAYTHRRRLCVKTSFKWHFANAVHFDILTGDLPGAVAPVPEEDLQNQVRPVGPDGPVSP